MYRTGREIIRKRRLRKPLIGWATQFLFSVPFITNLGPVTHVPHHPVRTQGWCGIKWDVMTKGGWVENRVPRHGLVESIVQIHVGKRYSVFLICMSSTAFLLQNPAAPFWTLAPSQFMWWSAFWKCTTRFFYWSPLHTVLIQLDLQCSLCPSHIHQYTRRITLCIVSAGMISIHGYHREKDITLFRYKILKNNLSFHCETSLPYYRTRTCMR